ncbi:MAG: peptide ABC transporter substrate-binding protein [Chloroflexi bacterium]|nr:peptide ABC transporter substrate-binding protein [Chloroflexota bacterium]
MRPGVWFLVIFWFVTGCGQQNPDPEVANEIIVTEVVTVAGEELTITRVIELTPTPTATPAIDKILETSGPVTLDIGFVRETPPNIDPQKPVTADSIDLIENLFVGLTRFNHETNQIEPQLAERWEVDDNGRVWTFYLRDDVNWVQVSEAEVDEQLQVEPIRPVTANDIVFAARRVCSQETGTPDAFLLFIIEGCEAVNTLSRPRPADLEKIGIQALNDHTLQVSLTKPAMHFLTLTSLWLLRPLPPELIEEFGDDWQTDAESQLVTSGPFFPENKSLRTLHRNPLWLLPLSGNVEQINLHFLESDETSLEMWQENELDVIDTANLNIGSLDEATRASLTLITDQTVHYLGFNFDSGVFREAQIRRAFSAAIDREQLVEQLFGDQALGMKHLLPPGVIGASLIDQVGVGYSPDYARQQLADSGFRNCRFMPDFTILVSLSDLSLQQAELIRRMWIEELGCAEDQISIDQAQFGTLLANTRQSAGARRPDIWELAWAAYFPDAHNLMGDFLHCEEGENRRHQPCTAVDDDMRQANTLTDPVERVQMYRRVENELFGENGLMPIVPLYVRGESILVQNWLSFSAAISGGEQYDTYHIDMARKELERSR